MHRNTSIVFNTDSYKVSMYVQYPKDTTRVYSYLEARGPERDHVVFFGLQAFIKEYLTKPITKADISAAEAFYKTHGLPFNKPGWERILDVHKGYLPIEIKAVPEGTVVPIRQPLVTVVNTDPELPWVTTWVETALVRACWYPSTVATKDFFLRQTIDDALEQSGDPAGAAFKVHDFGARGASSFETASIGGAAHLLFFSGTDTISGVTYLMDYYNAPVSGFSIPAAEHSTIIAWGKDHEQEAYQNMLDQFATPGAILAVVSDSYDIYHAVEELWGNQLKQAIIDSNATVVIRPDSGNAVEVNATLVQMLAKKFGTTTNDKGYQVLNHVRLIQGDGVDEAVIQQVIERFLHLGFSIDNIAFGMGAGLLQKVHRDMLGFAMKASAIERQGVWHDIFKDPVSDDFKVSKKGRVTLTHDGTDFHTGQVGDAHEVLELVFKDGKLQKDDSFTAIQSRALEGLKKHRS
jgi:nicotinamide phosphoribosyltransferase